MTSLAHVLAETGPGVHLWHSTRPEPAVRAEAAEIGWSCVVVEGAHIRDKDCFLEECERSYRFPAWFGHNWDALADCLADLSWLPPPERESGAGILTVFENCDTFARSALDDYDVALEVWEEVAEAWRRIGVPFVVLLRASADLGDDADDEQAVAPPGTATVAEPDLPKIGAPATRALAAIGVTRLDQLPGHQESELRALHGMGPKALGILREALAARGLGFRV